MKLYFGSAVTAATTHRWTALTQAVFWSFCKKRSTIKYDKTSACSCKAHLLYSAKISFKFKENFLKLTTLSLERVS